MSVWEWIISTILFIVALSVIITIHEAGHLSMAKLFNVYCQEFSIGFGPALLKKKRKGGETYFSIRAIPLGGYVSMYGEEMQLEDGVKLTEDRSLEGVAKWKKILIVSTGVILNAITAFVLILISNVAFPVVKTTSFTEVVENSYAYNIGIREDYKMLLEHPASAETKSGDSVSIAPFQIIYYDDSNTLHNVVYFVVDSEVTYVQNDIERHYVLTYFPKTTKSNNKLSDCLSMFLAASREEVENDQDLKAIYQDWMAEENSPNYYVNYKKQFEFDNEKINAKLTFDTNPTGEKNVQQFPIEIVAKDKQVQDLGVSLKIRHEWLPFGDRIAGTFSDFGNAAGAVFNGIGSLFTHGIKNMSGLVGIFTTSADIYGSYTFATYLYFWGLISINLAIFNLFPFPGLDGWQILVTTVEGITKKKIPNKVKSITSVVGLVLVFGLMFVIVVMDILRIVGVM